MDFTIQSEKISASEYIEFLKTTNLGTQYPKERFRSVSINWLRMFL